jgi:hypothetical protein
MYQVEWFKELDADVADEKLIGVFSTLEKAQEALDNAAKLPGFRDFPDCLNVGRIDVDKDHWTDGFFTPND